MSDNPEVTKQDNSALEKKIDKTADAVSGPLSALGSTLRIIGKISVLLSDLERAAYVLASKTRWTGEPMDPGEVDKVASQAEKLWFALHEAGVVFGMAVLDIIKNIPELADPIMKQGTKVDQDFIDGAIRISLSCFLINRDAPGILKGLNLDTRDPFAEAHDRVVRTVESQIKSLTPEQADRVDIYKLVGKAVRGQEIVAEECLMSEADYQALLADNKEHLDQVTQQAADRCSKTASGEAPLDP